MALIDMRRGTNNSVSAAPASQSPTFVGSAEKPSVNKPGKFKRALPWILLILVLGAAAGLGYWQYLKNQKLSSEISDIRNNPQKVADQQTNQLLDKVGKLIVLPDNEQPTVATVTDLEPLKDQAFFEKAKIGDKVLIYTNGKRAILYRESENKIVEVAPINIGNTQGQQGTVAGSSTKKP